ncbi:MAG: tryptophan 2,3-dioxygenase, partial [Pararhodobacter sp.]
MTDQPDTLPAYDPPAYDPSAEGARMSFDGRMSYGDYLGLDRLLAAQHPLSDAHDEMLFIIQHQTSELWMKLALHELGAARDLIAAGDLRPAFKMLTRVARIMEQLNSAWDVLRTMTPSDYQRFRPALAESSGFQSAQYRMIEFVAGNRNLAMIAPHAHRPDLADPLRAEAARPSLYDEVLARLAMAGFDVPPRARIDQPHQPDPQARAAWAQIYRDPDQHWELYELAEKLVD